MKRLFVIGTLAGLTFAGASAASAVDCPDSGPDAGQCVQVEAVELEPAVVPAANPVEPSAPVAVAAKQQLPVTGSDAIVLAAVGTSLVVVGGAFVMRSRANAVQA